MKLGMATSPYWAFLHSEKQHDTRTDHPNLLHQMTIKLPKSKLANVQPHDLILQNISIGKKVIELWGQARFNKERRVNDTVANLIRDCNGILGCGGNFKNGCLYREAGLEEVWSPRNDEKVICDHAVPVSELVRMHVEENIDIEDLIFYPVVRISQEANNQLTSRGFAKRGFEAKFPLCRYSNIELKIVTHFGQQIDTRTWTFEQHMELVNNTPELREVVNALRTRN